MPVSLRGKVDSQLEVNIAALDGVWNFGAGAEWDGQAKKFNNLSFLTNASVTHSIGDKAEIGAALSSTGIATVTQTTTLANLTIGPAFAPSLTVLKGSIGALGIRNQMGARLGLQLTGDFPTLVDCARVPLEFVDDVFVFVNYKKWDLLSVEGLFGESELVTADAKVFGLKVPLTTFKLGTCGAKPIEFAASTFSFGQNIATDTSSISGGCWNGLVLNAPPYRDVLNAGRWNFNVEKSGMYQFEIEYASAESRPVSISINGASAVPALSAITGGFCGSDVTTSIIGIFQLEAGGNVVTITRNSFFPHLKTLRFTPI